MNVTPEAVRALREASGLGLMDLKRALLLAEAVYGGDVMLGIGHRVVSGFAVHRKGTPAQIEASLARAAASWAEGRRDLPQWRKALSLLGQGAPAEGRSVTPEGVEALCEVAGIGRGELFRALRLADAYHGGDVLRGVGHLHCQALAVNRRGTPEQVEAAIAREAVSWADRLRERPGWREALAHFGPGAGAPGAEDEPTASPGP